jgi:predicted ATP-dependent endonuclease of OLD family
MFESNQKQRLMYLKKLVAQNFRLLENFEINFDPEVTVLIGPNYVGKSSVVDALLFLREGVVSNFGGSFTARESFQTVAS